MTMEFEELQRIWDSQNNQTLFVLNEQAMHKRIEVKKKQVQHLINWSEGVGIIANTFAGLIVLTTTIINHQPLLSLYLLAIWMIASGLIAFGLRVRRLRQKAQFDRTMLGELDHALSLAGYQVWLSGIMRWNIVPIGVLILFSFLENNLSYGYLVALVAFLAIAYYASGWEHAIYEKKKRELTLLREKLMPEETQ